MGIVDVVALIKELGRMVYPLVWATIRARRTWEGSGERLCAESTRNADRTAENRPAYVEVIVRSLMAIGLILRTKTSKLSMSSLQC